MSTICTAEEIAEKKRIALEKLKAKRAQIQPTSNNANPNTVQSKSVEFSKSAFYGKNSSSAGSNKNTNSPSSSTSAQEFLNALKQCSNITNRFKNSRELTHPYNRLQQSNDNPTNKPILSLSPPKELAPIFNKNAVACKVYLISSNRFAVNCTGFNQQLIDVFKTIPTKRYDAKTRIWCFAINDYQLLQKKLVPLKSVVNMGSIPKNVLNLCSTFKQSVDDACLSCLESTLREKLLGFQREGVCFAIAQHGRVMICDEMGLGKTYQALAIADFYREDRPVLICTTASTRESWASHVRELLPYIPAHYIQILTNNQQYVGDAKVLITSYNMMERHSQQLLEHRFQFLIFDESHMLKNSKAKCTNVADRLASQANRVILLSGTPALSRPVELFSQLQIIDKKFLSFMEYSTRYCDGKQSNFGWDANGQSNLEELNVVLRMKFMVRRTKADVLPELAEKLRETVVLDPSLIWTNDDEKTSLQNISHIFSSCKGRDREEILLKFYAQTAKVKTKSVCVYLKNLLKDKIKFIVFAHHRVMLDAITDFLVKSKVSFIRIDGSTKNETRAEYIDQFQKKSSCKVAVLSLKACNSGITLTAAEMIVFAELDWNPSTLAQAESRAHRIGQDKHVTCRYLMASKTADDIIWSMLKNKQDVLNQAGLFAENLQDASHTLAPALSQSIENYFSPKKCKIEPKMEQNAKLNDECKSGKNTNCDISFTKMDELEFSKEFDSMDEFLNDDNDDAFKDLIY